MSLPAPFTWLANEPGPKMLVEALKLYGTHEGTGGVHSNPVIMGWVEEVSSLPGKDSVRWFKDDHAQAWCGLYAAVVAKRAGKQFPDHPLWARNWSGFGEKAMPEPMLGDVLVFERPGGGGHVGFYAAEDATHYHVLGGNEGDSVRIVPIAKTRLLSARRPFFKTAAPSNIRRVFVDANGPTSTNEA
jgi:uncharacterized protein (TIGR02594 family)